MWYLVALIVALFPFSRMVGNKGQYVYYLIGSCLFYLIGVCLNSYRSIVGADKLQAFYQIFQTSRNGIFFAPFFLAIGAGLAIFEDRITSKSRLVWFIASVVGHLILTAETRYVNLRVPSSEDCSMYFLLPITALAICGLIISFDTCGTKLRKIANEMRDISVIMYCAQYGFIQVCTKLLLMAGIQTRGEYLVACTVASSILLYIAKLKIFDKLKQKNKQNKSGAEKDRSC